MTHKAEVPTGEAPTALVHPAECECQGCVAHRRSMWAIKLHTFAQDLSVRYGARVVLIGSAMTQHQPRDVDVRALLLDADRFTQRFGQTPDEWASDRGYQWRREVYKMALRMESFLPKGIGADFSIWPPGVFQDAVPHIILAEGWVDVLPIPTHEALMEECLSRAAAYRRPNPPASVVDFVNSEATFFEALAAELQKVSRATE